MPWVELSETEILASIAELDRIRTKINRLLDAQTCAMVMAPTRREPPEPQKEDSRVQTLLPIDSAAKLTPVNTNDPKNSAPGKRA